MTDIDRFIYLKRFLTGLLLEIVSGLILSSKNYKETTALLTGRYGNSQVLISARMDSLLKIRKVGDTKDKLLRKL